MPHLACAFCSIRTRKALSLATVDKRHCHKSVQCFSVIVGRKMCFIACTRFVCLCLKTMFLQHLNKSINAAAFPRVTIPSFLFLFIVFFSLPASIFFTHFSKKIMCTHTYAHTHKHKCTFRHKKGPHFLSVLISLGTIKSFP